MKFSECVTIYKIYETQDRSEETYIICAYKRRKEKFENDYSWGREGQGTIKIPSTLRLFNMVK